MDIDTSNIGRIERNISPIMPSVITIPLRNIVAGGDFVIYLSTPPFGKQVCDRELLLVAQYISIILR